jgi:diazepam-binding inhibitor (GABA receptor modulating acyl-CoA-binding protein)
MSASAGHVDDTAAAPSVVLDDTEKLQLYSYFKQAKSGDVPVDVVKPADVVEAAKMDAWATVRGLSRRDAMRAFIFLVYQLAPDWDNE